MSSLDQLERLHALQQAGALTDEEYQREKERVLGTRSEPEPPIDHAQVPRRDTPIWLIVLAAVVASIVIVVVLRLVVAHNQDVTSEEEPLRMPQPSAAATHLTTEPSQAVSGRPRATPADDWHPASRSETKNDDTIIPDSTFIDYPAALLAGTFKRPKADYGFAAQFAQAEHRGVNYAGHYALVEIGCGTDCIKSAFEKAIWSCPSA